MGAAVACGPGVGAHAVRSIAELLASETGRSFLEERGVVLGRTAFIERLRPPADERLRELLGLPGASLPVYVAHQTHVDLRRTVVSKLRAARDLHEGRISAVVLWLDTDRVGSDKAATTISWPDAQEERSIRLVPHRLRNLEARFAPVERPRLAEVVARLGDWIDGTVANARQAAEARARLDRLAQAIVAAEPATLARCNEAIVMWLLREQLAFNPASAFVSTLAARRLLARTLGDALAAIADVVRVFNDAARELIAADVDPQVRPLPADYLPLNYSCRRCGARRRLRLERDGIDQFAAATCSCGARERFHLGARTLSLGELEATERWSPDVTLPVYLNDLASGVVVGRSSALYGLVLDAVLVRALGRSPIPMLLPADLADALEARGESDSFLYDYLVGL